MQITISGQHLDLGSSLQEYVNERITKHVNKFFAHAVHSRINFTKEKHLFVCHIVINEGTGDGSISKGDAQGDDPYKAFDLALEKADAQLRNHKTRIKEHHHHENSKE